ncbi:hypothetical protein LBMAG53_22520 [Planctomycetota bacterium]|nr:hypothetical protein LBMAG53_22520 [Planctomycetota bacterium]
MDPGVALLALPDARLLVDGQLLPGAFFPLPLPSQALPEKLRLRLALDRAGGRAADGVVAALRLGDLASAWRLAMQARDEVGGLAPAGSALAAWAATERHRLGLATTAGAEVLVAADPAMAERLIGEARQAFVDSESLFAGLGWPPWYGPVVLAVEGFDLPEPGAAAGTGRATSHPDRPALPILRLPPPASFSRGDLDRWHGAAAAALVTATLAQTPAPAAGWPRWLVDGLHAVADARGRGVGPSPRDALERRQAAGAAGLTKLLTAAGDADPLLAAAVCTALCQPTTRRGLGRVLVLIRHGADGADALRIGAGLSIDRLLTER